MLVVASCIHLALLSLYIHVCIVFKDCLMFHNMPYTLENCNIIVFMLKLNYDVD